MASATSTGLVEIRTSIPRLRNPSMNSRWKRATDCGTSAIVNDPPAVSVTRTR